MRTETLADATSRIVTVISTERAKLKLPEFKLETSNQLRTQIYKKLDKHAGRFKFNHQGLNDKQIDHAILELKDDENIAPKREQRILIIDNTARIIKDESLKIEFYKDRLSEINPVLNIEIAGRKVLSEDVTERITQRKLKKQVKAIDKKLVKQEKKAYKGNTKYADNLQSLNKLYNEDEKDNFNSKLKYTNQRYADMQVASEAYDSSLKKADYFDHLKEKTQDDNTILRDPKKYVTWKNIKERIDETDNHVSKRDRTVLDKTVELINTGRVGLVTTGTSSGVKITTELTRLISKKAALSMTDIDVVNFVAGALPVIGFTTHAIVTLITTRLLYRDIEQYKEFEKKHDLTKSLDIKNPIVKLATDYRLSTNESQELIKELIGEGQLYNISGAIDEQAKIIYKKYKDDKFTFLKSAENDELSLVELKILFGLIDINNPFERVVIERAINKKEEKISDLSFANKDPDFMFRIGALGDAVKIEALATHAIDKSMKQILKTSSVLLLSSVTTGLSATNVFGLSFGGSMATIAGVDLVRAGVTVYAGNNSKRLKEISKNINSRETTDRILDIANQKFATIIEQVVEFDDGLNKLDDIINKRRELVMQQDPIKTKYKYLSVDQMVFNLNILSNQMEKLKTIDDPQALKFASKKHDLIINQLLEKEGLNKLQAFDVMAQFRLRQPALDSFIRVIDEIKPKNKEEQAKIDILKSHLTEDNSKLLTQAVNHEAIYRQLKQEAGRLGIGSKFTEVIKDNVGDIKSSCDQAALNINNYNKEITPNEHKSHHHKKTGDYKGVGTTTSNVEIKRGDWSPDKPAMPEQTSESVLARKKNIEIAKARTKKAVSVVMSHARDIVKSGDKQEDLDKTKPSKPKSNT